MTVYPPTIVVPTVGRIVHYCAAILTNRQALWQAALVTEVMQGIEVVPSATPTHVPWFELGRIVIRFGYAHSTVEQAFLEGDFDAKASYWRRLAEAHDLDGTVKGGDDEAHCRPNFLTYVTLARYTQCFVSLTIFPPYGDSLQCSGVRYSETPRLGHWRWPPRTEAP